MNAISRFVATALVVCSFPIGVAQAQWVFLGKKAVGMVRQMTGEAKGEHGGGYDSASVLLDANAEAIYRKAVEILKASHEYRLTRQSDDALTLEFTDGRMLSGLQIIALDDRLSQLLIVSNTTPTQQSGTSLVVNGVLRICREMEIHCELTPP